MRYDERAPSADLSPYVQCLWELESEGSALLEPIFPDGRIEITVHLGDCPRRRGDADPQPRLMIVGQTLTATRLEPVRRLHTVGVRFTPAGARAWLGLPLHEITGCFVDAAAVRGTAASRLRSAIEQATCADERFTAAESAVRAALRPNRCPVNVVSRAVRLIEHHAGTVTIDALARACGVGARQLERRFLDEVGITPKAMARISRFQRALRGLRSGTAPAEVATTCGFADQPHLAREFRAFAGLPAREVDLGHVAFLQDLSGGLRAHW
jgi:AraC-like DNA-binding protein